MPFHVRVWVGIVVFGLLSVPPALGQQRTAPPDSAKKWHEDAWTHIVQQKGIRISYIYYPEADNEHDGIVLRLDNDTDGAVRYGFTIIFRAPEAETTTTVQGMLRPGQMKTGEDAGLFWIPFEGEDHNIGEIGLRNLEITPAEDEPSAQSESPPSRTT